MTCHDPDQLSCREASSEGVISEHGCVDSRWSDAPSIQIGVPEDNMPDEYKTPDQIEDDKRRSTIGKRDPNIDTVFDDEGRTTDVPTRDECKAEYDAWCEDSARALTDRLWDEAALAISEERHKARELKAQPPMIFMLIFNDVARELSKLATVALLDRFREQGWAAGSKYDTIGQRLTIDLC